MGRVFKASFTCKRQKGKGKTLIPSRIGTRACSLGKDACNYFEQVCMCIDGLCAGCRYAVGDTYQLGLREIVEKQFLRCLYSRCCCSGARASAILFLITEFRTFSGFVSYDAEFTKVSQRCRSFGFEADFGNI